MSDKLPWFPFYINDWETDHSVRAMGPVARSYYLILLMVQWREGYIPDSRNTLRRLLTLPSDPLVSVPRYPADAGSDDDMDLLDYEAILEQVLECFSPDGDGRLSNRKLKSIRDEQLRVVEAKSRGGKQSSKSLKRVPQDSGKTPGQSQSQSQIRTKPPLTPLSGGNLTSREYKTLSTEIQKIWTDNAGANWTDEYVLEKACQRKGIPFERARSMLGASA